MNDGPDGQQCPYYIPRGDLNLTCIREPGQTCSFTCNEGYRPSISPPTIACGSELEWNHNPERLCKEINCPILFERGYVAETCSRKYKATCSEYHCNPGYVKLGRGSYLKCEGSGKWIDPDGESSLCGTCDMQIPHGYVTPWCAIHGPPCPYFCHEGYKNHYESSWIQCSTSGQLVPYSSRSLVSAKDLCTPKPCPGVISKGAFSAACKRVVGSTCSFSCEAGYMRNASVSELTCQTSTEWSPDLTSLCLRPDGQQCSYYIPRGDLSLTCIREPGQTCSFTCDEGYQPSISPPTIACGSELEWNNNPEMLCKEINCPNLFEGGYVAETCSRKYNATCSEYHCNPGYAKLGRGSYLKCEGSGTWIDPDGESSLCGITRYVDVSFNVSRSTGERSDDRKFGTIVAITLGCLLGIIIIIVFFVVWIAKRSSVRKSQRGEPGHVGSTCLRRREHPVRNVTTIRQQPNADGIGSASSLNSPSCVHSFVQWIPTSSSSSKYSEPPPSYSKTPSAPSESPPTYEEVARDPSRFNLYI